MTSMIARWERGLRSVVAFHHPGRMRHADQENCVLTGFIRGVLYGSARMLLKQVVNVLHTRHRTLLHAIDSFVHPAYGRPQRDSVVPDQSALTEPFKSLPDRVVG